MTTKQNKPLVVTEEALAKFLSEGHMRKLSGIFDANKVADIKALIAAMGKK